MTNPEPAPGLLCPPDPERPTRRALEFGLWVLVGTGLVVAALVLVATRACSQIHLDTNFAGQAALVTSTSACSPDAAHAALRWDFLLIGAYSLVGFVFLRRWWGPVTWDSEPGRSRIPSAVPAGAILAAGFVDVVETAVTDWQLETDGAGFRLGWARFVTVAAWVKWVLLAAGLAAVLGVVLAWTLRWLRRLGNRMLAGLRRVLGREPGPASRCRSWLWRLTTPKLVDPPDPRRWTADPTPPNFAICCSGGGIRSAAFTLGALSALEETEVDPAIWPTELRVGTGLLGAADYLASVSGGGYAAAAWRVAATTETDGRPSGLADRPVIGDPSEDRDPVDGYPDAVLEGPNAVPEARRNLYAVIRRRREFLRNGPGGLLFSAVGALMMLVWHLSLIVGAVFVVSWPLGRVIDARVVGPLGVGGSDDTPYWSADGAQLDYVPRLWAPPLWLLAVLGVVLLARIGSRRSNWRRATDAAAVAVAVVTGAVTLVVLVFPWLIDLVVPILESIPGGKVRLPVIFSGGVAATVIGALRSKLESRAKYLGGVFLGLVLLSFALLVMQDAALTDDVDSDIFTISWPVYLVGLGVYLAAMLTLNPDVWSLQWIYRLRMSQTFANRVTAPTDPEDELIVERREGHEHHRVSAYAGTPGPKPLICCAAAREDRNVTGIPAVSFTIDPDEVIVHQWSERDEQVSSSLPTTDYEELVAYTPGHRRQLALVGAASLSGAAFAPSMGKIEVGTTQALLAALNLRLGVWMPNPGSFRRASPPFINIFKEVFGSFDVCGPNLYVTDGGHWENLALVEMVRRRARVIISIDASGDKQYSHSALNQAIELAKVECDVTIAIDPDEVAAMKPRQGERMPTRNWAEGVIHYPATDDLPEATGRLLYVKAQRSRAMPLQVLRYGQEDETFPNYSTGDQFLADEEFSNLVVLGRESMIMALRDKREATFADLASAGPGSPVTMAPDADEVVADDALEPDETGAAGRAEAWEAAVTTPRRMPDGRYLEDPYDDRPPAGDPSTSASP